MKDACQVTDNKKNKNPEKTGEKLF